MKRDPQSTAVTTIEKSKAVARRTTSWSHIAALEGEAAQVVADNRPLPDLARGLVDVAQKARKVRP